MPADLHPKKDPKPISIPPSAMLFIIIIIMFIIAVIMALGCQSFYNAPLA